MGRLVVEITDNPLGLVLGASPVRARTPQAAAALVPLGFPAEPIEDPLEIDCRPYCTQALPAPVDTHNVLVEHTLAVGTYLGDSACR